MKDNGGVMVHDSSVFETFFNVEGINCIRFCDSWNSTLLKIV